jgi:RNA polymerase sigma factor (sigma-70 family)
MDDHGNSYTQELSRAIDVAHAQYRSGQVDCEDVLYNALLAQANNVVSYRLQQRDSHLARDITRRAIMALAEFRDDSKISTWFYRIAQNELNRALRNHIEDRKTLLPFDVEIETRKNEHSSKRAELDKQAEELHEASHNAQLAKLILEKIREGLPPKQADVIAQSLEGHSLEDIAENNGEPVGTIRGRYLLAKRKMAARVKRK